MPSSCGICRLEGVLEDPTGLVAPDIWSKLRYCRQMEESKIAIGCKQNVTMWATITRRPYISLFLLLSSCCVT
jgi:hypothetical protein